MCISLYVQNSPRRWGSVIITAYSFIHSFIHSFNLFGDGCHCCPTDLKLLASGNPPTSASQECLYLQRHRDTGKNQKKQALPSFPPFNYYWIIPALCTHTSEQPYSPSNLSIKKYTGFPVSIGLYFFMKVLMSHKTAFLFICLLLQGLQP